MAGGDGGLTVAGFDSGEMKKGAPSGWELVEKDGTPNLTLEKEGDMYVLHLKSDSQSSFGIKKEIDLKAGEYPFLSWEWKVARLPDGADVRKSDTDDQAIQIYVAFKPTGWPAKLNTPVIGYIWGVECPKDTFVTSSQPLAGKIRYVVLRNKEDALNTWVGEKRNLEEDYRKLFPDIDNGQPRDIKGISFYINSQNTKSEAESYIYNVHFSSD
ncbi:MAG: DUF3047 domain-containing protein [Syntrophales bacterium]|nr:DUF3047 domain-containing protein [Syntrophales bacterium]